MSNLEAAFPQLPTCPLLDNKSQISFVLRTWCLDVFCADSKAPYIGSITGNHDLDWSTGPSAQFSHFLDYPVPTPSFIQQWLIGEFPFLGVQNIPQDIRSRVPSIPALFCGGGEKAPRHNLQWLW